jgi:signal transduction histidine kinase
VTLAAVMSVLLVVLVVGWVLLTVNGALADTPRAGLYWTMLSVGTLLYVLVLAGVGLYLALSIKAINLNRRQANFTDSVTHELKSPIASLKLCLQTLDRRQLSSEEQADFHRCMLEDVARLDALINDILDAGQLDKRTLCMQYEPLELVQLFETCSRVVQQRYQIAKDAIILKAPNLKLQAPRAILEMIVRNLMDNAVKYGSTPTEVIVQATHGPDRELIIQIIDNGPGIAPKLRRKIFGRFVRLGVELERRTKGTGLGLYIVRSAIKQLRGSVRVYDRSNQKGSVFEVTLPNMINYSQPLDSPERFPESLSENGSNSKHRI